MQSKALMTSQVEAPKFEVGLLIQTAAMAGVDLREIPHGHNPWTCNHPKAKTWQAAVRHINPLLAQDAEVAYGPPISIALQAALDGETDFSDELAAEFSERRPHLKAIRRESSINSALEQMASSLAEEQAALAAKTPTQAQLQASLAESNRLAAATLARAHMGVS